MKNNSRSYHFDLKKDRFWIWIVTLPFGLISWAIPFVLLWGLMGTGLEQSTSIVIAFIFLGIPAYLVGWIFVYSLMEGLITRVSFTDSEIIHRTPSLIFPLFWKTKKIQVSDIENINFYAPYGSRIAILLFVHRGNKIKKYYLPRFKDQPEYLREFQAFNEGKNLFFDNSLNQETMSSDALAKRDMLAASQVNQPFLRGWDKFLKLINGILIFIEMFGSGYYCLQLPYPPVESFSAGISAGMVFVLICLLVSYPVISQLLIWFYARKLITLVFSLFNINSDSLFLPSTIQNLIRKWTEWGTIRLSLTDFVFWCIFFLSVLYAIDRVIRWFSKRVKSRESYN
jgi:hypothetical protein